MKNSKTIFVRSNNPRRAGSFELNALQSLHCDHGCSFLNLVPGRCVKVGWAWRPPLRIRRLGSRFSEVDSVSLKKCTAGCVHGGRTLLAFFKGKRNRPGKTPTPNVGFHVKPRLSTPSRGLRFHFRSNSFLASYKKARAFLRPFLTK